MIAKKRLKIAQIGPIVERIPPKKYGGTERVIFFLTEELVRRGHEVTLFASGDSQTRAKLVSVYPTALRESKVKNIYGANIWSLLNVGLAYQQQDKFDIIHDHNSQNNPVSLPLANLSKTPVVMTLHGPLMGDYGFSIEGRGYELYELYNKPYLVTISKKQAYPAPHLHYAGNVYHGMKMNHYPYSNEDEGYLLFVGRVHLFKGVDEKGLNNAIEVAKRTGLPLLIAAKLDKSIEADVRYFKKRIQPQLSDKIKFLGEVDEETRNNLMSKAIALLHTINFEEPFGLTMIEAMACGLPVIGFNKGSVPEVVLHGKTGFVVKNIEEAVDAVGNIKEINRAECRSYALERFSERSMADGYEQIYYKILEGKADIKIPKIHREMPPADPHVLKRNTTSLRL